MTYTRKTDRIFPQSTREECLKEIQKNTSLYSRYQSLNDTWQNHFLDFMAGKKTLPLTYDPIFKKLFNPDIYPERLSRLISSILGVSVNVVQILPQQESMLDGNALLIMDILVQLEDGSLANVEIQKIPYEFPAERMSCYSSDLVLRQYSRVKGDKGRTFTYKDMKPVYTIILFEKSGEVFKKPALHGAYIHYGETVFDTGLELKLLQRFYLISLDVFQETQYPKDKNNELTAWLSLLSTRNISDIDVLLTDYPWLEAIYRDMAEYLHKPEEVLTMFSDALKILDQNTVQYMIEELQNEIKDKDDTIMHQETQITNQATQIANQETRITDQATQIAEMNAEIAALKAQLAKMK